MKHTDIDVAFHRMGLCEPTEQYPRQTQSLGQGHLSQPEDASHRQGLVPTGRSPLPDMSPNTKHRVLS